MKLRLERTPPNLPTLQIHPIISSPTIAVVQTYGVTFDWDIVPKWRLAGTAFYDREDAIGDDNLNKKVTATLALTHDVNDHLEVFISGLGKWVTEDVSGDSYDRYKLGTGLRFKF